MENWLAILTITIGVISAGIAWWQSALSRQHAQKANRAAEEANRIQSEIAERDRLRFEAEQAMQAQQTMLDNQADLRAVEFFDGASYGVRVTNVGRAKASSVWLHPEPEGGFAATTDGPLASAAVRFFRFGRLGWLGAQKAEAYSRQNPEVHWTNEDGTTGSILVERT